MSNANAFYVPQSESIFSTSDAKKAVENAIVEATGRTDWCLLAGWSGFAERGATATPREIVIYTEAYSERDGVLKAPADLMVALTVAKPNGEVVEFSDSFPASLILSVDADRKVELQDIKISFDKA